MLKVSTFSKQKMRRVLFLGSSTTWEVPSGVDYCTARICGGGGGAGASCNSTAGANSTVSCGAGVYSGVGGDSVLISYMGLAAACRSGRESSGQSAFFAGSAAERSGFAGVIPAAVNEFGINLEPEETVTITVGAGGVQGDLHSIPPGPGTANGGSGFVNIEYWI